MYRTLYTIQDMSPPQHLLTHLHQLRNTMFSIPNKFLELKGDQGDSFGSIEPEASRKPFLRKEPKVGKQELVLERTATLLA
jgi:hypothetical protein